MRFHPVTLPLLVVAAVLSAGCAQTSSLASRAPWLGKPRPVAAAKSDEDKPDQEAPSEEQATAEKPGEPKPGGEPPAATPAETTEIAKATDVKEAAAPVESDPAEPAASEENPPSGLDVGTLMLMNEHLKQVPFAERERLYQEWKALDAETIREKIRQRESGAGTSEPPNGPGESTADSNTPAEAGISPTAASALAEAGIVPAAFEVAAEATEATTDIDEERERPIPLMDGLIAEGAAAPPEEQLPAGETDWEVQVRKLIPIAQTRAETTHALYLESQAKSPDEGDATANDALRRDYIASQVDLRLLYLMANERARALQIIPDLEPADQEFWRQVLWGMASYFDAESFPDRSERVSQTIDQLRAAINKLQGEAKLQLQNVAFCRKITSFGNFERFDEDTYSAGQKVLLYAEILNFKSIPGESDGLYKTQLKSTIEILRDGETEPLQRIEFDPTVDLCRSHRQDYFHSYELKLPADLDAGPYVLKLTVQDIQSDDVAVYTLNFTVE